MATDTIEEVVRASGALAAAGLSDMVWGHAALRDPDGRGIWMKAAGWGFEEVDADRVLLVSPDGEVLSGAGRRHIEYPIHAQIMLRRPDVGCTVHTHAPALSAFSCLDTPLLPISHDGVLFCDPALPRFTRTGALIATAELGAALAGTLGGTLGDANACLICSASRKDADMADTLRLTHYGHAYVLAELPDGTRILFDPGSYSAGFEDLPGLDAVLITHEHPDHHDTERQARLAKANPGARVVTVANAGDSVTAGGTVVRVRQGEHAVVHPDLPNVNNNAYQVGDLLFHPGDSFTLPAGPVRVLLLPAGGPWMKLGESADYLRAVAPEIAVPVHQAGLAETHRQLHYQVFRGLAPSGTTVVVLDHNVATAL